MRAFLRQRPELDMVHWKDPARGNSLEVRVLEFTDSGVRVQKTLAAGLTNRVLPLSEISDISFARTSIEHRLIHQPTRESADALRVLWEQRIPTLSMDGSHAPEVGLALAKALRMGGQAGDFAEAETLLDTLAGSNLNDARKTAVANERQTLKLAQSIQAGEPGTTDAAAWETIEADPGADAMLMATAWLADRHFEDLKALEKEHPRWDLDDEVRPTRSRLYHLALDFALYPSLFHGTRHEESAAGLAKAAQVHLHTNAPELALQSLEDLAALYPESQAAIDAAGELTRLRTRIESQEPPNPPEPETTEETNADVPETQHPTPPATPPQPKRYSIFED